MMKKRLVVILLCLALSLSSGVAAYADGMDNFRIVRTYTGQFTDIDGHWYRDTVIGAYELGLAEGKGTGLFVGEDPVKLNEAITMAARINALYFGRSIPASNGKWYEGYVGYAVSAGIIKANQFSDYERAATRGELAQLIYAALPSAAYYAINEVDDGAIPDVTSNEAVYTLYRAGVLTGYIDGSFSPSNNISRAEAFTILCRAVDTGTRKLFTLKNETVESDDAEKLYFIGTVGAVTDTVLTLYPETGEFYLEFGANRIAYGYYQPDGPVRHLTCILGERFFGTLPGENVSGFTFTYIKNSTAVQLTSVTAGGITYVADAGVIVAISPSGSIVPIPDGVNVYGKMLGTMALGDYLVSHI